MHKVKWYITKSGDYAQGPYKGTIVGCYYDSTKKCAMLLVASDTGTIYQVEATKASLYID
jgi:hypothetical protein